MPTTKTPHDAIRASIAAMMVQFNVSQIEVARGTKLSKTTVCDFLQGKRGINTVKATKIIEFLEKQQGRRRSAAGRETS